jgi:2-polyprenyl-3-methyl-5-hydroxy-6-metoxy-1,4-benzoquinol methylase
MDCPVCLSSSSHHKHKLYDDRYGFEGHFNLQACNQCDHNYLVGAPIDSELGDLYTNFYPRKSFNPDNFRAYKKGSAVQNWLVGGKSSACQSVTPGSRVLDIGCGYGETLAYMESIGCDVYGIDADRNVIEIANKFGFKIHIGVFHNSIYESDFFDFVTMNQVIEHVPNINETFLAISKILKPGGSCVISTPNANGWGAKLFGSRWVNWHAPYHQQFISNKSIQMLAELHGFQIQKIETITRSEWLMYQVLHLLNYPQYGEPSSFWAPYKQKRTFTKNVFQKIIVSSQFLLIPQMITRIFDSLGFGDNYLVVLKKK